DPGAHGVEIGDLAGIPLAIVSDLGCEPYVTDVLFEPEAAQDLHRVRVHLNAGADPSEGLRLLVDMCVETDFAQRRGRGQTCDAGTDDRYCGYRVGHRALRSESGANACTRVDLFCR